MVGAWNLILNTQFVVCFVSIIVRESFVVSTLMIVKLALEFP